MRHLTTTFFLIILLTQLQAAGPVINEVLYDPANSEGSNATTCEAVEIAATPGTDLSCHVITDGDYVLVIPNGTTAPADGFFLIGSSGCVGGEYPIGDIDLDITTCSCLSGTFSMGNTGEFVALFDGTNTFLDGVIYESPTGANSPDGATSENVTAPAGCSNPATITPPTPASFATIATNASGISITRDPNITGGFVLSTASTVGGNNSLGSTNDGNPIPPAATNPGVPTLSEWGLINLALLLMTFGTLSIVQIKNRSEA